MLLTERIAALIEPTLIDMGYELVRVQSSGGQRMVLQVMAERSDRQPMTVQDCTAISRQISAVFDVEDPMPGAYHLEVSSPGIDRPLTKPEHFSRFVGLPARIETRVPVDGRKRFKGVLDGIEGDMVRLVLDPADGKVGPDEEVILSVAHGDIARAKLLDTAAPRDGTGGVE